MVFGFKENKQIKKLKQTNQNRIYVKSHFQKGMMTPLPVDLFIIQVVTFKIQNRPSWSE